MEGLVPVLVPLNLALSGVLVFKYHRDVNWPQLRTRILPFTALGLPIGLAAFVFVPGRPVKIAFGVIVLLLATLQLGQLWRSRRMRSSLALSDSTTGRARPWTLIESCLYLVAGGIMQGLYASGGPFVVYYSSRAIADKSAFRSTLCVLWLILNSVVCITLVCTGKITFETLRTAALLLPAVLLGMILGDRLHSRISEQAFRVGVYLLLALSGASLIFRN